MNPALLPDGPAAPTAPALPRPGARRLLAVLLLALGLVCMLAGLVALTQPRPSAALSLGLPGPLAADRPEMNVRGHYPEAADPAVAAPLQPEARGATTTTSTQPEQPLAWLTVPRLGLTSVPIYDRGVSASHQMLIAGGYAITHYQYSGALGSSSNAVLYGHDDIEGGVFGGLSKLRPGDQVQLRRPDGTVLTYRVRDNPAYVSPNAVNILDATAAPQLTLFSCYPLWVDTQRVVVVAVPA